MVVHGEDIRHPLGFVREYPPDVLAMLLRYYAGTDMVVVARSRVRGLRLEASDLDLALGDGPLVQGSALALIMTMTGRRTYCDELSGPGVTELVARLPSN
jgi:hypothetical protein